MADVDDMLKTLKLAWISRMLRTSDNSNWCISKTLFQKSKETESKSWIHYSLMGFEDKCITFNQEKQFYM